MALPSFMFYPRDFLASTFGWSAAERGHYLTLLCVQWEQGGLPSDLVALESISPGVGTAWDRLAGKFALGEDGRLRNPRLEAERGIAGSKHAKASERAKRAAEARWKAQQVPDARGNAPSIGHAPSIPQAMPQASNHAPSMPQAMLVQCQPEPEPEPDTHTSCVCSPPTPSRAGSEWQRPGWALTEWQAFVAVWNGTKRATPWKPLTPPDGWADVAATTGWLDKARAAMAALPGCRFFEQPLAVTRFMAEGFADRILAGEFNHPKASRPGDPPRAAPRDPSRRWRDDACANMTDTQYAEWRASRSAAARSAGRGSTTTDGTPQTIGQAMAGKAGAP